MAGCMFPLVSVAREVMECSPGVAFDQGRDQNFQVDSDPTPSVMLAGIQGPPSTLTSTLAIGPPQAAPTILYPPSTRLTRAGADLSKALPTSVSVQTDCPSRCS